MLSVDRVRSGHHETGSWVPGRAPCTETGMCSRSRGPEGYLVWMFWDGRLQKWLWVVEQEYLELWSEASPKSLALVAP